MIICRDPALCRTWALPFEGPGLPVRRYPVVGGLLGCRGNSVLRQRGAG